MSIPSDLRVFLDAAMGILWMITYILVLIGTVKYRFPLISPITPRIIAPFEFAMLLRCILAETFRINFVFAAYLFWSLIELVIITVNVKKGYLQRQYVVPYIALLLAVTAAMVYQVTLKGNMLFYSHIMTTLGVTAWLHFIIRNKEYPMNGLSLTMFITKLLGDILDLVIYGNAGPWPILLLCIILTTTDMLFVVLYWKRKTAQSHQLKYA